mmetsp:Transcript_7901/g.19425  ORF Transcript_7901/g.19425 Transcript_7901/m.19425 type:complete len:337 (+) Transcript_7901:93-1103(+)
MKQQNTHALLVATCAVPAAQARTKQTRPDAPCVPDAPSWIPPKARPALQVHLPDLQVPRSPGPQTSWSTSDPPDTSALPPYRSTSDPSRSTLQESSALGNGIIGGFSDIGRAFTGVAAGPNPLDGLVSPLASEAVLSASRCSRCFTWARRARISSAPERWLSMTCWSMVRTWVCGEPVEARRWDAVRLSAFPDFPSGTVLDLDRIERMFWIACSDTRCCKPIAVSPRRANHRLTNLWMITTAFTAMNSFRAFFPRYIACTRLTVLRSAWNWANLACMARSSASVRPILPALPSLHPGPSCSTSARHLGWYRNRPRNVSSKNQKKEVTGANSAWACR